MIKIHQKTDGVTTRATTKAVKHLLIATNRKARGFFGVKRAAGDKIRARFFEGKVRID
jgi:hypothetical protein